MREGGNSAAAREMIADERNTLEWVSLQCSHVPIRRGRFCSSAGGGRRHLLRPAGIGCTRLCEELRNRIRRHPRTPRGTPCRRAGLYVDAVRLRENGVADGDVELPGAGAAARPRAARSRVPPRGCSAAPGARSIRSNAKWGLDTRSVRSSVSRFGFRPTSAGPASATAMALSTCSSRLRPKSNMRNVASLRCWTSAITRPAPIAWMVPAGTKTTSPGSTVRHATRPAIEPSSTASRNCRGASRCFRPRATLAPGAALRMYQASVLP